jgi:Flp pilus assembly protein TadG
MMMRRTSSRPRGGALVVEMAFILSLFCVFLFSVFEYSRYVMIENVLVNAVREGCRYAMVHCQDATVTTDVNNVVTQRMAGLNSQLTSFTVVAFPTNNPSGTLGSTYPGDPITVKATGTLKSLFPAMPYIPTSVAMSSACVMTCEGN